MLIADINNISLIINCIAVFVLFGILVYFSMLKKGDQFEDWLLIGAVSADTMMAACAAFRSLLEGSTVPDAARLMMGSYTLYALSFQAFFYFLSLFLLCQIGRQTAVRSRWKQIGIPFVVSGVYILCNLWGHYLFYTDAHTNTFIRGKLFLTIGLIPAIIGAYVIFRVWPQVKTLIMVYLILLVLRIYFSYVLDNIAFTPLFLAVGVLYTLGYFRIRGIMFQLGTVIFLLFTIMALFVGNFVTVSAFSSYLTTVGDVHSSEIQEVTEVMNRFEAISWLMDYWIENAGTMTITPYEDYTELNAALTHDNVRRVTVQEAESLPPALQYQFANQSYIRIAQAFETAMMDFSFNELFLLVPAGQDSAMIIFDGRKNKDGSYRLGEIVDMAEMEEAWKNYLIASSKNYMNWTWLRFNEDDKFGFSSEFRYSPDQEPAYLVDMFLRSEVYTQMAAARTFRMQVLWFFGVITLIVLAILYMVLVRPLRGMKDSLNEYRQDKDTEKLVDSLSGIRPRNEIGMFAEDFSAMAQEMEHYTAEVAELAGNQERVSTELRMASQIQDAMLPGTFPAFPDRTDFDLYAMMDPAKAVGGDFYDFFLIDETHLAILIADVSDKGVPAALFMMSAMNLINYRAKQGGTPGEILTEINNHICSTAVTEMFVTVWMGILDTVTGKMLCTNAGHERPALRGEDGVFRFYTDRHGLVVGGLEGIRYKDYELQMKPGDAIFVYTDGVPEANNSAREFYGMERLERALNSAPQSTPEEILKSVRRDVEAFVQDAEQFDDLTMLCLVYKGSGNQ